MNEIPDPFELLKNEAVPSEPTDEDGERARRRLEAAIARDQKPSGLGRRWPLLASAAALVAAVVLGVSFLHSPPAEAALGEIAEAARTATPLDIPDGSFVYTQSERVDLAIRPGIEFGLDREFVAYLLPSVREVWRSPDTNFIQIRTTTGTPSFFDRQHETAYYAMGLEETDQLGEERTEQFTDAVDPILEFDWPTATNALHQALVDYTVQGGDERPEAVQVFSLATSLLREADPSPQLRAAVLEVIAGLPVELDEQTDQSITIAIVYDAALATRDTITLNSQGWLVAESSTLIEAEPELGIPAGTRVLDVTYRQGRIVEDLT